MLTAVEAIPTPWIALAICSAATVGILSGLIAAFRYRRAVRRGDRRSRVDQLLLGGALVALAGVYVTALAMNASAQMQWAQSTLQAQGIHRFGVTVTLDGLCISVALFAAWLVRRGRDARMAWLTVWLGTATSIYISATEGATHGRSAAIYLGVVAFSVMLVFHLITAQTHPNAGKPRRRDNGRPGFGARWATKLVGTDATPLLWLAWVNTPPPREMFGDEPTINDAIQHRRNLREARAGERRARERQEREHAAEVQQHLAELARQAEDAANVDTIADLQARLDQAITANDRVAAERADVDARVTELGGLADELRAELEALRVGAEQETEKLRAERDGAIQRATLEAGLRRTAEAALKNTQKDGAQKLRRTTAQGDRQPTVLMTEERRAQDDRDKAKLIRSTYETHRKTKGESLPRYQVEIFKPDGVNRWGVKSRQAERIIAILDAEFAADDDEAEQERAEALAQ